MRDSFRRSLSEATPVIRLASTSGTAMSLSALRKMAPNGATHASTNPPHPLAAATTPKATPRARPRMICQWSFVYQGRRGVSIGVCRRDAGSEATMGGRQRSEEEGQKRDGRAGGGAGQVDAVVRHPWDARREREWEAVVLAPLGEGALGEAVPRLHGRAEEGVEEGARQRAPGDEQPHRRLGGAPGERRREWERATEDDGGAEERRGGTGHGN